MTDHSALDAVIASLGITYNAEFVPFSQSRNAKAKAKISDLSVNWRVTIARAGASAALSFVTDYQQGIGHLPEPLKRQTVRHSYTADAAHAIQTACEGGLYYPHRDGIPPNRFGTGYKKLPAPELRDVLYCLVSDASVIDSPNFESWAADSGYDTDSRQAEAIYRTCLEQALKLRAMIGDAKLTELREAFQDY